MRAIDPELAAHLKCDATTLAHCWIIRREDGLVQGFTEHDRDLEVSGVVCQAASGFLPSEAQSELGLAVDSQDVAGVLSSSDISDEDVAAGRYDNARVETWIVNWKDGEQILHLRTALLGHVTRKDNAFQAELRGLTSLLEQRIGRSFNRSCDAQVGDSRRTKNLNNATYKAAGVVTATGGASSFSCSGLSGHAQNWFRHGLLTWTSGENEGLQCEVASNTTSSVELWLQPRLTISEGDAFTVTAGCDKSFSTCRSKFSNQLNFRGFPHMPGNDFSSSYAALGVVHDGKPLVR